jgi:hypothetical protein
MPIEVNSQLKSVLYKNYANDVYLPREQSRDDYMNKRMAKLLLIKTDERAKIHKPLGGGDDISRNTTKNIGN